MKRKSKSSDVTKRYRRRYRFFKILSWILTLGPLIPYVVYGYIIGGSVEKIVLSLTTMAAVPLGGYCILFKKNIRNIIFVILLGVYLAVKEITVLLIIVGVCTVLDELIITPLENTYREKTMANKQIDGRIKDVQKD